MKKHFLPLALSCLLAACGGGESTSKEVTTNHVTSPASVVEPEDKVTGGPAFSFAQESFNFGEIVQGQVVEHSFQFTNSGDEELVITSAKGSCGCTVPEWPKQPIKPGGTGVIKVTFNSKGKRNHQDKVVTLKSNAKGDQATMRLHIIGEVLVKEEN